MINQLLFKNFVSHKDLRLNKLGSVNLILGKNDTGKTAILKMMYVCNLNHRGRRGTQS